MLLAATLNGCRSIEPLPAPSVEFAADCSPHRGTFIVVHGLNNRPDCLESFEAQLRQLGFGIERVTLVGHEFSIRVRHGASRALWLRQIDAAVRRVRMRSPREPLWGLGYSLGGALLATACSSQPFDGLVLLAPALRLRPRTYLTWPASLLAGSGAALPSFAPQSYRACDWTSVDCYKGLFDTVRMLSCTDQLRSTPTLVMMGMKDELVDAESVQSWIVSERLQSWQFVPIRTRPWHHLLLDESCLGETSWKHVVWMLRNFLQSRPVAREV